MQTSGFDHAMTTCDVFLGEFKPYKIHQMFAKTVKSFWGRSPLNLMVWFAPSQVIHMSCVFFCNVGSYHFVGAYAGATACLRGHSGSLRGQKLKEICLRGLRACGFVQEAPTRLQSRRFF